MSGAMTQCAPLVARANAVLKLRCQGASKRLPPQFGPEVTQ